MTRIRSRGYPNQPLDQLIESAAKVHDEDRQHPVDRETIARHIGFGGLSGASDRALSALLHYGLMEKVRKGELRVSDLALAIIHPHSKEERRRALHDAGFNPDLFRELRERYPEAPPSREALSSYLSRSGFAAAAIPAATKAYLETCSFLQQENAYDLPVAPVDGPPESPEPEEERGDAPNFGGARVGDLIQWEINGALQMEKPMRVRLVQAVDGIEYVAVDGSEAGIPMDQVTVVERGKEAIDTPRFALDQGRPKDEGEGALSEGWKEERLLDDGGEEILIRYRGDPTPVRYTFIRDYLDFKLTRMTKG